MRNVIEFETDERFERPWVAKYKINVFGENFVEPFTTVFVSFFDPSISQQFLPLQRFENRLELL